MKYIPYGKQFIDQQDIDEVIAVLKGDFITQGPKIVEFEEALARYCSARYAVVFNSGTSALHAAYFSVGLKEQDQFLTSPNTFAATSNAGLLLGAKPVFVDVEKTTGNMDPSLIDEEITEQTRLIVPVHYAGHPADMKSIGEVARKHGLFIVEDACHALGARYLGIKVGSCAYSDATVFSFHPVKHITTGEGGAVLTNQKDLYDRLNLFRSHGIVKEGFSQEAPGDWYYEMKILGCNYRLTDFQAVLGRSQLRKLDAFVKRRREIADKYNKTLQGNPYFDLPEEKQYALSSYHLYSIRVKEDYKIQKREVFNLLRRKGLGVQVHYIPVYLHPYYRGLGYGKALCPIAEDFYEREISIPIYPSLKDEDVDVVIDVLMRICDVLAS